MATSDTPSGTSQGAAFFDLDRTLLRGASGEVFSEAMKAAGLVSRNIPGEKFLYQLFNTIGETLPSMALARQAVNLAKGHSQAAVQEAAEGVADRLVSMVQPFAEGVFEMHREAGRPIVLATTTPYDLVKPFADRLGLDDVVATKYRVESDGDTYTGSLAGPFVWSTGKLAAPLLSIFALITRPSQSWPPATPSSRTTSLPLTANALLALRARIEHDRLRSSLTRSFFRARFSNGTEIPMTAE